MTRNAIDLSAHMLFSNAGFLIGSILGGLISLKRNEGNIARAFAGLDISVRFQSPRFFPATQTLPEPD